MSSFSKCWISHLSCAFASCCFTVSLACSSSSDCCQLAKMERAMETRSLRAHPIMTLASSIPLSWRCFSSVCSFLTILSLVLRFSAMSSIFSTALPTYSQWDGLPLLPHCTFLNNHLPEILCLWPMTETLACHTGRSNKQESRTTSHTFLWKLFQAVHAMWHHLHHFSFDSGKSICVSKTC